MIQYQGIPNPTFSTLPPPMPPTTGGFGRRPISVRPNIVLQTPPSSSSISTTSLDATIITSPNLSSQNHKEVTSPTIKSLLPSPDSTSSSSASSLPPASVPRQSWKSSFICEASLIVAVAGVGYIYGNYAEINQKNSAMVFAVLAVADRIFSYLNSKIVTDKPIKAQVIKTISDMILPAITYLALKKFDALTRGHLTALSVLTGVVFALNMTRLYSDY